MLLKISSVFIVYRRKTLTGSPDPTHANGTDKPCNDLKGIVWLVASLQIWNSNNADVLLNSGLNLFDIMANLCPKLYYEVLLKSWNYIAYLLKWTSALDSKKRGCVRQI